LDLSAGAWVIILLALANYFAVASAWLLARPALRAAVLQGNLVVLEIQEDTSQAMREAKRLAIDNLRKRIARNTPRDRRSLWWGVTLLVMSLLTLSAGFALQVGTEPVFGRGATISGPPCKPG
jgi:hypothetical protein